VEDLYAANLAYERALQRIAYARQLREEEISDHYFPSIWKNWMMLSIPL